MPVDLLCAQEKLQREEANVSLGEREAAAAAALEHTKLCAQAREFVRWQQRELFVFVCVLSAIIDIVLASESTNYEHTLLCALDKTFAGDLSIVVFVVVLSCVSRAAAASAARTLD